MLEQTFAIDGQAELQIDVACDLKIEKSSDGRVHVIVKGDEEVLEGFEINQYEDCVVIKQGTTWFGDSYQNVVVGNVTQINGATYLNNCRASNIHIGEVYSEVYVNGQRVSRDYESEDFAPTEPTSVTVWCPEATGLDLDIRGQSKFISTGELGDTSIECSGQVAASIKYVRDFNLDVAGQCTVAVNGQFEKIIADVSGQSDVNTYGICSGKYFADASGMSTITHYGEVLGLVRKERSGMATINI